MGIYETANTHTPTENEEFSTAKKELSGDAVCSVELKDVTAKKDGKRYLILEGTAINIVPTKSKKAVTLEIGDQISKVYDISSDDEGKADKPFGGSPNFLNDMFTAGINFDKGADLEELIANATQAVEGKLVYFSTWRGKKWTTNDDGATFEEVEGETVQKIKVLSSNKITPENSTAQIPF